MHHGIIREVHDTHFTVDCAALNDVVILLVADACPMRGNLHVGSEVDFDLDDYKVHGRFLAKNLMVPISSGHE